MNVSHSIALAVFAVVASVAVVVLAPAVAEATAATASLSAPSTKSTVGTVSCAGTATRISCPSGTKALHVRNNNATTVCFGGSTSVTTTNAAVCLSTTLGLEHARNATGTYCISAGASQTVAYECLQ